MIKNPFKILLALVCLFSIPAVAQEGQSEGNSVATSSRAIGADFSELRNMGVVSVKKVADPLRVLLQDGRVVQLAGLNIPSAGDHEATALDFLTSLLENKEAVLYQTRTEDRGRRTRLGHHLGHLTLRGEKPLWIQGALLANGLARIEPSEKNTEMSGQMLLLQNEAIKEKRGLWADERYGLRTPETAGRAINDWAVVEGRIKKAAAANNTVYLNFGDDWRSDFTIGIEPDVRRGISRKNISALDLGGKKVRVTGWIESYNGPFIRLMNAAWLEILPEDETQDNVGPKD